MVDQNYLLFNFRSLNQTGIRMTKLMSNVMTIKTEAAFSAICGASSTNASDLTYHKWTGSVPPRKVG